MPKNHCKWTVLVQLIIENVVNVFWNLWTWYLVIELANLQLWKSRRQRSQNIWRDTVFHELPDELQPNVIGTHYRKCTTRMKNVKGQDHTMLKWHLAAWQRHHSWPLWSSGSSSSRYFSNVFFLLISLLYNWPMHRDFMKIKFDKNESGHLACETSSPNPLNLKMAVKLVLCAFLSHIWGFRQHFKRQTFLSFSASLHTSRSLSRSSVSSSFWPSPSRVTLQTSAITIIISAPFNHYS